MKRGKIMSKPAAIRLDWSFLRGSDRHERLIGGGEGTASTLEAAQRGSAAGAVGVASSQGWVALISTVMC
jgi:hypothetical protein